MRHPIDWPTHASAGDTCAPTPYIQIETRIPDIENSWYRFRGYDFWYSSLILHGVGEVLDI